jgi:hypothetical protein
MSETLGELRIPAIRAIEQEKPDMRRRGIERAFNFGAVRLHLSGIWRSAKKRDTRNNLIREDLRQPFQGRIFRGNRCIFGTHDVNTGIGAGRGIQHNRTLCRIDQPIARAQGPAFTGHGIVAADAESRNLIVQLNLEPILRRYRRIAAKPVIQGIAHQPARLAINRRDIDGTEHLADLAAATTAVKWAQTASRKSNIRQERRSASCDDVERRATMTFLSLSSARTTFSLASATDQGRLIRRLGSVSVSRNLPLI